MAQKIQDYEGKNVTLIYDGSDLPTGRIGPQEVNGKLTSINLDTCTMSIRGGTKIILLTRDIQLNSIKILKK